MWRALPAKGGLGDKTMLEERVKFRIPISQRTEEHMGLSVVECKRGIRTNSGQDSLAPRMGNQLLCDILNAHADFVEKGDPGRDKEEQRRLSYHLFGRDVVSRLFWICVSRRAQPFNRRAGDVQSMANPPDQIVPIPFALLDARCPPAPVRYSHGCRLTCAGQDCISSAAPRRPSRFSTAPALEKILYRWRK